MRDDGHQTRTMIHTMGYEKSDLASFVDKLVTEEIDLLVDIRERPLSRKKGFSKNGLRASVEGVGIDYIHIRALGDPKPGREAAKSGDFELFQKIFTNHMCQPEALCALKKLSEEVFGRKICLMCFERDHHLCHRKIVSEMLSDIMRVEIKHIKP